MVLMLIGHHVWPIELSQALGIEGMGHDFAPGAVRLMMNRLLPFLNAHTPA
jgi:hypothetical protein